MNIGRCGKYVDIEDYVIAMTMEVVLFRDYHFTDNYECIDKKDGSTVYRFINSKETRTAYRESIELINYCIESEKERKKEINKMIGLL